MIISHYFKGVEAFSSLRKNKSLVEILKTSQMDGTRLVSTTCKLP